MFVAAGFGAGPCPGRLHGNLGRERRPARALGGRLGGNQPDVDQAITHGKFTFKKDGVEGPPPFDCKQVQYTLSEVGPDYLFEGGLTDPVKQAAALGFTSQKIVSLNMGCISNDADIEMDFDLIDHDTAVFALNNVIYRMVRAPAQ